MILMPSLALAPSPPVFFIRSDPARSTKVKREVVVTSTAPDPDPDPDPDPGPRTVLWIRTVKMAWDRLLWWFMRVAAVVRFVVPWCSTPRASAAVRTGRDLRPTTTTPPSPSSLMGSDARPSSSRSCTLSPYTSRKEAEAR